MPPDEWKFLAYSGAHTSAVKLMTAQTLVWYASSEMQSGGFAIAAVGIFLA